MKLEDYLPDLEEETGPIKNVKEWAPGVYYIETGQEETFWKEFFAVLDGAPIAAKVRNYGKKMDGLRLFALDDNTGGWRIVQYEISKYRANHKRKPVPEEIFHDLSLHAIEVHPEYFGTFPVPYHTPDGYTLRHRTLANGIYWLETSTYKELLAVCFPIWNAELSAAALTLAKVTAQDRTAGISRTMSYLFFAKEFSCVPVYELMETRKEWDGTVIHRPALMNALWEYAPKYTRGLNGGEGHALDARTRQILEAADLEILPQPAASELIGMFPDVGTDFLLLE